MSIVRSAKRYLSRVFFERRFGLETTDVVELADLDLADETRRNYIPSGWGTMKQIARHKKITPDDVFVDFGSGKGRMVFLAAQYPLKRVVGVELSAELHAVARENIDKNRRYLKCQDVRLVNEDVLKFEIPSDMTIGYFFNPFTGDLFRQVIDRIADSVRAHPRRITLVYTNPVMHDYLVNQRWLEVKKYAPGQVGIYETRS